MQNIQSEPVTTEDKEEYLKKCTVAIRESQKGISGTIGTGVIVNDDGLILTCYHVIGDIRTKTPYYKTVDIHFHEANITKPAEIVEEYCNPSLDVAFLRLQDKKLPEQQAVAVAYLSETVYSEHKFKSFGFRKPKQFAGLFSDLKILGRTREISTRSSFTQDVLQLSSEEIEPGMSGAAVLDLDTNRVVGIVFQHNDTRGTVDTKLNFAIPIESILKEIPVEIKSKLKEKNPGLSKISDFLYNIGLESELYKWISELYISPLEYEGIKDVLKEKRIVFITGEQEYGKTYTALRMLWEFYNKDHRYQLKYIQNRQEGEDIIQALQIMDKKLHNSIIYFEDPFGRTSYENNKQFQENVGRVIDNLENIFKNTYIIITSREEFFREFERRKTATVDLEAFKKSLNIHSYDYKKRLQMLLGWASAWKCKWLEHNELKDMVVRLLNQETKLPTPLNIKDFIIATLDVADERELLNILDAKSQETAKSFAEEIKHITQDKIKLFFSFLFVSDYFTEDFVKSQYQALAKDKDLDIKIDNWEFDRILRQFRGSKIDIGKEYIRFSHPSYSEAVKFLLLEDGIPTDINIKYFSKILLKLANYEEAIDKVIDAVSHYYNDLPQDVKNLLFKLADDKASDIGVAYAVAKNADKLPANVRNLLSKIAIDNRAAEYVEDALSRNFDKFPHDNVTKELFIKLADNQETTIYAAKIAAENFSQLPANVMNEILKELVPKFHTYSYYPLHLSLPWYVYKMLLINFNNLSNDLKQLLFEIIDEKYGVLNGKDIIILLMDNLKKYPYNIRNELLLKFENSFGLYPIVGAIPDILDKISEDILDELVLRLVNRGLDSDKSWFLGDGYLYDKLSDNAKSELLHRFVNENRFTMWFKKTNIYDKLSDNAKSELLHRFVNENRFTMEFVSYILIKHSDNLPKDLAKELVLKLMNQYHDRLHLALIIIKNHEKLDYSIPVVTNILFNLALDDSYGVSKALLHYFDVLPVELKKLLFKFADNKKTAKGLYDILTTQEKEDPFDFETDVDVGNIYSEISENISDDLIDELTKRAKKSLAFHPDRRKRRKKQLENNDRIDT